MVILIDLEQFKSKFHSFRETDFDGFGEFWRWKLRTETQSDRILDVEHINEAYKRLSEIIKVWKWYRPYGFSKLARRLKDALEKIRETTFLSEEKGLA